MSDPPRAPESPGGNDAAGVSTGTVKWFNSPSGFGAITDDEGGELFVFRGNLVILDTTLTAGDRVSYTIQQGGMGTQAFDVRPVDARSSTGEQG